MEKKRIKKTFLGGSNILKLLSLTGLVFSIPDFLSKILATEILICPIS